MNARCRARKALTKDRRARRDAEETRRRAGRSANMVLNFDEKELLLYGLYLSCF